MKVWLDVVYARGVRRRQVFGGNPKRPEWPAEYKALREADSRIVAKFINKTWIISTSIPAVT